MYLTLGVLAVAVVLYAAISGRVDGSRISGPIAFVVFGLCLGPAGSNLLSLDLTSADLRLLAELTLALVLFCDAANADVAQVRRARFLPRRLLFLGLPSTIALGYGFTRAPRAPDGSGPIRSNAPAIGIAGACFALAQAIGGSGFIACFAGGVVYAAVAGRRHDLLRGAEGAGELLSLLAWVVFGALVAPLAVSGATGATVVYAVLNLTLVRMAPVWVCLRGTRVSARDRLFVGWFGPRGLASVVFGILILSADTPHATEVAATIGLTVLLSVLLHGLSAHPAIRYLKPYWAGRSPQHQERNARVPLIFDASSPACASRFGSRRCRVSPC